MSISPRTVLVLCTAVVAVPGAGCLRGTTFTCATDTDCNDGVCEAEGVCSFADSSCDSGRRYGELSGTYSDQCVGATTDQPDAPPGTPDAPPGTPDAPPGGCPTSYGSLAGAPNVYRSLPVAGKWVDQQILCVADGAYLVIPDTAGELTAVTTLGGIGIWVGISDTVQGTAATVLPWAAGQPDDDPPGEDCVSASSATEISDERCTLQKTAVCECVP